MPFFLLQLKKLDTSEHKVSFQINTVRNILYPLQNDAEF